LQINAQDGALTKAPRVRLAQNYVVVQPDTDTAQLLVDLASPSKSAVKVFLGLFSHDGTRLAPQIVASWAPGEVEPRSVEVSGLQELLGGIRRSLVVRITATEHAVIDTLGSSALVSLDTGLPQFAFRRNAAAFPGDQPKIEILLESGQITRPATLRYRFEPLFDRSNPAQPSYLRSSSTSGFLHVDVNATAQPGQTVSTIAVPIDWNQVREDAQYKLQLQLEGFYASWAAEQGKHVALHVFGVAPGTCPPGSAVKGKVSSANDSGNDAGSIVSISKKKVEDPLTVSTDNNGMTAAVLDLLPGGGSLSLLVGENPVSLSSLGSNIGAMVGKGVEKAVLCLVSNSDARVIPAQVQSSTSTKLGEEEEGDALVVVKVSASMCSPLDSGVSFERYTAWEIELLPGPNLFNISSSSSSATSASAVQLSIVRLADPSHARVLSLEARGLDGGVVIVCGPPSLALGDEQSNTDIEYSTMETKVAIDAGVGAFTKDDMNGLDEKISSSASASASASEKKNKVDNGDLRSDVVEMVALDAWKPCAPGGAMSVTVPSNTETVSLTPTLLHPEIRNIRVEVNGQVLSRGGDVWADQQTDTQSGAGVDGLGRTSSYQFSSAANSNSNASAFIMPAAFIMGMQPGSAVDVEVVVVAEDGVTSSHYPVTITRDYEDAAAAAAGGGGGGVKYSFNKEEQREDWPASPAELANCDVCLAGWTSATVNASTCEMCPPGTAAARAGTGACTPCGAGTFSLPWGSTHCKHCISGTHAPTEKATICLMCPDGFTTVGDGQVQCNVTLAPATDLQVRYAVVVYFSVKLTGSDPEDIVLRSGVSAPAEIIVSNLLRTDTAAAFNISMQDVNVLSVHRVAKRILQASVSATLGLDLPGNATEEDITTALEVQKLSADRPIELLSEDPDSFFGRTTKTLDVGVEAADDVEKVESRPLTGPPFNRWILVAPGIVGTMAGSVMIYSSWRKRRGSGRQSASWIHTLRITPAAQRYVRQA
jgi:hypothetical protein